jgi:hypothetical protein
LKTAEAAALLQTDRAEVRAELIDLPLINSLILRTTTSSLSDAARYHTATECP